MRNSLLALAASCEAFLAGCAATTDLPPAEPVAQSAYAPERSYASNVGAQFGIHRIEDNADAAKQLRAVAPESHLARNLGLTVLANSPLNGVFASKSAGPFTTSLGLDFAGLGWKPDTTAFEAFDHWFAAVPAELAQTPDEALRLSMRETARAFAAALAEQGYTVAPVVEEAPESSLQDETLERMTLLFENEALGCPKNATDEKSRCRLLLRAAQGGAAAAMLPVWLTTGNENPAPASPRYKVHRTLLIWSLPEDALALGTIESSAFFEAASRALPPDYWLYRAPRPEAGARLYEAGVAHEFATR